MVSEEKIREVLGDIEDPEMGMDIVNMGFIREVETEGGEVKIEMTLTSPGCPLHRMFTDKVKDRVSEMDGVEDVNVELVFDPPWSPEMMSDEAKKKLGWHDEE
ncbi:MAG: metal-sulfur cluster assembly factor [Candidatus Aenigmatarchaeota archaeon]